jgi:hypothetical protein
VKDAAAKKREYYEAFLSKVELLKGKRKDRVDLN